MARTTCPGRTRSARRLLATNHRKPACHQWTLAPRTVSGTGARQVRNEHAASVAVVSGRPPDVGTEVPGERARNSDRCTRKGALAEPVASDERADPGPLHPLRCADREPLRPQGHSLPGWEARWARWPGSPCSQERARPDPGDDQPIPGIDPLCPLEHAGPTTWIRWVRDHPSVVIRWMTSERWRCTR